MKRERPKVNDRVRFTAGELKGKIGRLVEVQEGGPVPGAWYDARVWLTGGGHQPARLEDLEKVTDETDETDAPAA